MRCIIWGLALVSLAACSPQGPDAETANASGQMSSEPKAGANEQHLAKVPLIIRHGEGKADTRLQVEIALTPQQQEQGLQNRTDLTAGDGMVFPMDPPRSPSFWMKDTPLPLDLIFIRTDGSVARIIANAQPGDRTPLFAEVPVAGVLELLGGSAAAIGLDEDDHVNWGECTKRVEDTGIAETGNFCPAPSP